MLLSEYCLCSLSNLYNPFEEALQLIQRWYYWYDPFVFFQCDCGSPCASSCAQSWSCCLPRSCVCRLNSKVSSKVLINWWLSNLPIQYIYSIDFVCSLILSSCFESVIWHVAGEVDEHATSVRLLIFIFVQKTILAVIFQFLHSTLRTMHVSISRITAMLKHYYGRGDARYRPLAVSTVEKIYRISKPYWNLRFRTWGFISIVFWWKFTMFYARFDNLAVSVLRLWSEGNTSAKL